MGKKVTKSKNKNSSGIAERDFTKVSPVLELPDLIEVQTSSFYSFLQKNKSPDARKQQGLQAVFEEIFPIESADGELVLEFVSYSLDEPLYTQQECQRKGIDYSAPIRVKLRLAAREKKGPEGFKVKFVREHEVYFGEIPLMTPNGTFIINGSERVIVCQLHRSPGIFFERKEHPVKRLYSCKIIPYRGTWLDLEFDQNNVVTISIDGKRRFPVSTFLKAVGYEKNEEIISLFMRDHIEKVQISKAAGKVLAGDVRSSGGDVLAEAGEHVSEMLCEKLKRNKVSQVSILAVEDYESTIIPTLARDTVSTREEALSQIYRRLRPGDPFTLQDAEDYINRICFNKKFYDLGEVGRFKINRKLGLEGSLTETVLKKEDVVEAARYLFNLMNGDGRVDDIDHLGNRRVRTVGELVQNQFRIGLARIERVIRERFSIFDPEDENLAALVHPKIVMGVIKDFFARSQLSQFMDQVNPLAELTHKRRLSALGPGGLSRERAGFEVRDVHFSHYGRICPIETPEGANIGLIVSLSNYARVNDFGFIETPYRKVLKGKVQPSIEYLDAYTEDEYMIAQANAKLDRSGKLAAERVFARYRENFLRVSPQEINYMDVSPLQLVSSAAGLIPFLEHDDANRALMGCNMQRQAVPLIQTEAPLIKTGMEGTAARDSGAVIIASAGGRVVQSTAEKIVIESGEGILKEHNLIKFIGTNQNTCVNQKPLVNKGDTVKEGDVIADGPSTKNGELALGRNVLAAFMPWLGYNFEDAIVISERLVKEDVFTSIHIEELDIDAREKKLGVEEITRDIPNMPEGSLGNLDEEGIIRIGSNVSPGDVLVGKITYRSETELTSEEKLLRSIFGDKARNVKDASLKAPSGMEGIVVDVKVLSREKGDSKENAAELERIKAEYKQLRQKLRENREEKILELLKGVKLKESLRDPKTGKISVRAGSTLSSSNFAALKKFGLRNLSGGQIESGKFGELDVLLGAFEGKLAEYKRDEAREIEQLMRGDELPHGVVKVVKVYIASKRRVTAGDKMAGRHGNKGVIATVIREEDMPYMPDGTPVDIVLNPLGVPSRMNVGQILETHLGWAARVLGFAAVTPVFGGASEMEIKDALEEAGLPRSGKTVLYDGRTGEKFDQEVTAGYIYMMKLSHLVDDKVHARSTGPYSLVTQQPLGGKAHSGGQRFGEMEVWALEAYGAAYTLQELLTVKSDDVEGRTNMYEAICKGEDSRMAGTPESFNVLIKELQGLGLSVNLGKKKLAAGDTGMPSGGDRSVFDSVAVGIASPSSIKEMSRGEVKKPETINYRTLRPEKDGLFCEKIFGPTRDFECNCGKYKRVKHKGVVCDRCGVEVTHSRVRRERIGHISLKAPIVHIWFFKVIPSRIGNLLDIPVPALERVIYYESYIVTDPGKSSLDHKQVLTEDEYRKYRETYGDDFTAMIGAEGIQFLLSEIDLPALEQELQSEVDRATSKQKLARLNKRLAIVRSLRESGNRPEWMVMNELPVIPADLRPLVPLDGGRVATSDLNDLYRRVINRNERLKNLIDISAPDIIIRNEKRMLQEAVDALFDNGRRGRPVLGAGGRPLKSLSDNLRGKQGRFRQNLLGKRVDYSGRSVVVVGPELSLHQCGLPKKMALQLFEPFIVRELRSRGFVHTIKSARKMVEEVAGEVWAILEDVIKEHPVLLNRAPTLHRLGIQAFEPILIEGKSIQIHPLVCTAFNADFDGDQMAVHVPLSTEAQLEARVLMASNNNLFSPSSGRPIVVPSQDIVLGCSYITKERGKGRGNGKMFSCAGEVLLAYWLDYISLHAPVRVKMSGGILETTVGRVLFNSVLPEGMPFYNEVLGKKQIEQLITDAYSILGHSATVRLLDALKDIGFKEATRAGISISADDMVIPSVKAELIEQANEKVDSIRRHYRRGIITERERFNKVVDVWMHVSGELSDILLKDLSSVDEGFNPIYMMADSGARGNFTQIRQLAGMRGLMAKPSGEIIESPIIANFREGLTVLEYFISTHGARKGLADTALKTADSGYLTRRLVDVAQDVIVVEQDCGTSRGIEVSGIFEGEDIVATLYERILGRTALEDIKIPLLGNILVKQGEIIDDEKASLVEEAGIDSVKIRSVLTCRTRHGICAGCYGWDLALKNTVNIGTAAGIIAAQSIGEPGTQLTMRTFHIGGTASRIVEKTNIIIREEGIVKHHGLRTVLNREGSRIVVNRNGYISLHDEDRREIEKYHIPVGALLKVDDNSKVDKGVVAAEWDPYTIPIFSEVSGKVEFEDIEEGLTAVREIDEVTGHAMLVVIEHKEEKHPQIVIRNKKGDILGYYTIPTGSNIMVKDGDAVEAGDLLAKNPRQIFSSRDITGGLPRVASLFEARRPKDPAIISEIAGIVEFAGTVKGMRKIVVKNESGMQKEYLIPPGKHLNVYKGDRINEGDALIDGPVVLEDKLRVSGESALQEYLLNEVQEVYRLQGVTINDKHIEVIMRQMLRKVRIDDKGDTRFLVGEEINRFDVEEENERVKAGGGRPAGWAPVIMGVTKASLATDSFISAASFQETTRVLTDAAVRGRTDELRGLKENVIMGKLIPAGTGVPSYHDIKLETPAAEEGGL